MQVSHATAGIHGPTSLRQRNWTDRKKVEAVVNFGEPANSSEVRSFLSLDNYNARFIPNFASIAEPSRRLTKRGAKFEFGPEQRASFNKLKQRLANAETLEIKS